MERLEQKSDLVQVNEYHCGCWNEKRLAQGGQGRSRKPAGRIMPESWWEGRVAEVKEQPWRS